MPQSVPSRHAGPLLAGLALCLGLIGCDQPPEDPVAEADLWVAEYPDDVWAWSQAAVTRMNAADYAGAAGAFERLIQLQPDEPSNYAYLALARAKAGHGGDAGQLMDQAVAVARRTDDPSLQQMLSWRQEWAAAGHDPRWPDLPAPISDPAADRPQEAPSNP